MVPPEPGKVRSKQWNFLFQFFEILNRRIVGRIVGEWEWVTHVTLFALVLLTARFPYRKSIFLRT